MGDPREYPAAGPSAPADAEGGESFVARWSRRKHQARAAPQSPEAPLPDVADTEPTAAAVAVPERVLTDADMPPIESLNADSDYKPFLSPGVSEELRRLALRKLFRLPEFNQRFELDGEYYDCTNLEPLGSIITYDMREEMKRAAEKLAEVLEPAPQADAAPAALPTAISTPVPRRVDRTRAADELTTPDKKIQPAHARRRRTRKKT